MQYEQKKIKMIAGEIKNKLDILQDTTWSTQMQPLNRYSTSNIFDFIKMLDDNQIKGERKQNDKKEYRSTAAIIKSIQDLEAQFKTVMNKITKGTNYVCRLR